MQWILIGFFFEASGSTGMATVGQFPTNTECQRVTREIQRFHKSLNNRFNDPVFLCVEAEMVSHK